MGQKNKWVPLLLSMIAGATLAGCSGSGNEPTATMASGGASEQPAQTEAALPTAIKAMTIVFGTPPAEENNKAREDLGKRGNVDLSVSFVPAEAYQDKLSVAISAENSFDLLLFDRGKDNQFVKLVQMGAFHDLTPYLDGASNLNEIEDAVWRNTKVDGKVYGIPRQRGLYGGGEASFAIRKDWLDQYSLSVPTTLDELTNALKVFRENDPVGGGKTIPLVMAGMDGSSSPAPFSGVSPIQYAFGVPFDWRVENGQAVRDIETQEYKSFMNWMRDAWQQGLIDKDAPVLKNQQQAQEKFLAGTAGVFSGNATMLNESNVAKLKQADPNSEIVIIDLLEGPDGHKGVLMTAGYYGLWAVPSSVPKDKVQKIVDFLNFTASEENAVFGKTGVVGVHSNGLKDGVLDQTEEQKKQFELDKPDTFLLENRSDPYIYANSKVEEIREVQKKSLDVISKFGIENPFLSYSSATLAGNADSYKKINTALTRYVLGEVDWDAVQKEIEGWSSGVGAQIKGEMMEQYNADHK